MKGMD